MLILHSTEQTEYPKPSLVDLHEREVFETWVQHESIQIQYIHIKHTVFYMLGLEKGRKHWLLINDDAIINLKLASCFGIATIVL